jgi:hypothetical protein
MYSVIVVRCVNLARSTGVSFECLRPLHVGNLVTFYQFEEFKSHFYIRHLLSSGHNGWRGKLKAKCSVKRATVALSNSSGYFQ